MPSNVHVMQSRNRSGYLRQIAGMVRGEGKSLLLMLVLAFTVAFTEGLGITILLPLLDPEQRLNIPLLSNVVSHLNSLDIRSRLYFIAIILASLLLLRGIATYWSQQLEMVVPSRISRRIALRLHEAYLAANLDFAKSRTPGEIHTMIAIAPERATKVLKGLLRIVVMLPLVAVSVTVMMTMSVSIAIFALVIFSALYFGVRALLSARSERIGRELSIVDKALSQSLFESVRLVVPVKLMNAQRYMLSSVDRHYEGYVNCRIKQNRINAAINPLISIGSGAAIVSILVGIAAISHKPESEISRLLVLVIAMSRLPGPAAAIGAARMQILSNRHAMDEIEAFLTMASSKREACEGMRNENLSSIRFSGVTFSYPRQESLALEKVDFTIDKGSFVALVGPSGAGKSTVLSLMAGFYAPTQGQILVDGTDLQAHDVQSWRKQIGFVAQDMAVFNGTVFENIAFQRPNIDERAVSEAVRMAGLEDFVESLPDRYNTTIGDSVRSLSGGQKQRLMIARALVNHPKILVFDEATASLDAESEAVIQATIEKLRGTVTILWVSHRMHTVTEADLILVFGNGQLVARGRHEELARKSEAYRALMRQEVYL